VRVTAERIAAANPTVAGIGTLKGNGLDPIHSELGRDQAVGTKQLANDGEPSWRLAIDEATFWQQVPMQDYHE
jgi:hypothetical protein